MGNYSFRSPRTDQETVTPENNDVKVNPDGSIDLPIIPVD